MYACNTCQSDCTSFFNSQQLVYIDISLNCTPSSIDWITNYWPQLSIIKYSPTTGACQDLWALECIVPYTCRKKLSQYSHNYMLYSTIVLTMQEHWKYPMCVCHSYWPRAQSQANVAPMLLTRDASTQDCQCFRVMSYAGLTQTLWEGELMRLLKREMSCATLSKHHELGLAMWGYIATRG